MALIRDSGRVAGGSSRLVTLVLLALLSGCTASSPQPHLGKTDSDSTARVSFLSPVVLQTPVGGQEPSIKIAPDGTIYICSIHGASKGTDLWRSLDQGKTFENVGSRLYGDLPPSRTATGELGGEDCDIGVDAASHVYLVDDWVGSATVTSSTDQGKTWTQNPISTTIGPLDRPWALGGA